MSTLKNKKIKDTYEGLLKTSTNLALDGTLTQIQDGTGQDSGVKINNLGDIELNKLKFTALEDSNAVEINEFLVSSEPFVATDTKIPTVESVKTYVDTKFATSDTLQEVLSFGNTTGGNDIVVSLNDDITFTDSSKILMGAASDLQIYHDGANSFIKDTGTGDLYLEASTNFFVRNADNGEVWIKGTDAGVSLRFQDAQKLITTNTGVNITGRLSGLTDPTLAQDAATKSYVDGLDAGNDLDITDGTNTGDVNLNTQTLSILGTTNEIETVVSGQGVTIGLPSSISTDLVGDVTGNVTGDLTGTASKLEVNNTAVNQNERVLLSTSTGSQDVFSDAGLLFNPVTHLLTVDGSGIFTGDLTVTGNITGGGGSFLPLVGGTMTGNISMGDSVKSVYGNATDGLEIFNSSSAVSNITKIGDGDLYIESGFVKIGFEAELMITGLKNDTVELYYNNSRKLHTTNTGIQVTGNVVPTGNVFIQDAGQLILGASLNGRIYHDGSNFYANNSTGQLNIEQGAVTESIVFKTSDANALDTTALIINRGGDLITGRDVTIAGDLTVNGTTTTVNSQTLSVDDPLISLAINNAANSLDIGYYGKYNDGTTRYLGLFNDASDSNKFKLFRGTTVEPTTTVNIGGAGYLAADLVVAGLEGTSVVSTGSVIAASGNSGQITLSANSIGSTNNLVISTAGGGSNIEMYNTEMYFDGNTQYFRPANASSTYLTLNSTSATFAGDVEIRSGKKLILQRPNNGVATEISTDSTGAMILNSINDEGFFFNNSGTTAFKLDPINATFAGNINVTGSGTFTNDITIDNGSPEIYLTPDATKYSWMIAAQENIDQNFEITPSTTVGGTTFNAPALKINGANSNATFAGNVGIDVTPLYKFHTKVATNGNIGFRAATDFNAGWTGSAIGSFNDADNANTDLHLESSELTLNTTSGGNVLLGGNLGIATTSPDTLLQATNTADGTDYISYEIGNSAVNANNKGGFAIYELGTKAASLEYYRDGSGKFDIASHGGNHLSLSTTPVGGSTTERMRIDSSGLVRVGPNVNNAYTFDTYLQTRNLLVAGFSGTGESNIYLHRDDQTISNGNILGNLNFSGQDGASNIGAVISGVSDGSFSAGNAASSLVFKTTPSGSVTPVARMRIDSSGNVNIYSGGGTSEKTYTATAGLQLYSQQSDAGSPYTKTSDIVANGDGTVPSELRMFTKASGSSTPTERMRINPQGIVSISNGTPTFVLANSDNSLIANQIIGDINFSQSDPSGNGVGVVSKIRSINSSSFQGEAGLSFHTGTATTLAERMRIDSTGNVLFGTTGIPNGTSVYGSGFEDVSSDRMVLKLSTSNIGGSGLIYFYNPNGYVGAISVSGSTTTYATSSDYRLKEDLKDFNGLELLSNISVYNYKWKTDESRSYGVMAHELQEVLPDAVTGEKDAEEMQGVDYSKIVPLLIKSIQELTAKVERLEAK